MSQIFIKNILRSIIMIASSIMFGIILLDKNLKKELTLKKMAFVIIEIILYSLIITYIEGALKTILLGTLYIALFKNLFSSSISTSIILAILNIVIMIIPDTLCILFFLGVLKVDSTVCYKVYGASVWASLVVAIVFVAITFIFKRWLRKAAKIKLSNNVEILIYSILPLISIVIIFYNAYNNIEVISRNLFVSSAIMVVFTLILYKLIRQKVENVNLIDKYDKLLEFIKKYEREIDIEKMLRHETKNQLITIRDKILNNDTYKIEGYINSIIVEHVAFNEEKYSKFQFLPANGIKGLFYYKSMEAEAKGLKLSINVSKAVEKSNLSKLSIDEFKQLGRLIGIYLDNAIDASKKTKNKQMGIEIYMRGKDVEFIISNSFEGELDLESIGNKKYTTKGKDHGYGLMLAKKILNSYSCFEATRTVRGGIYSQSLMVKMKKINNKKEHLKLTD